MTPALMPDAGDDKPRGRDGQAGGVVRQCAVSREQLPVEALIRFVIGPDDAVVPDLKRRLPGRGVWLTCDRDTLETAAQKGHFARAFKSPVTVAPDLSERVDKLLAQAALSRLSLANKAGAVVAGFTKVEQAIASGRAIGLLHAEDGSDDGCRKLDAKYKSANEKAGRINKIARCFNVDELSLALGRSNVVHAAVIDEQSSSGLFETVGRLETYRAGRALGNNSPALPGRGEE